MTSRRGESSAFEFDWYASEAGIDAYVRECWATGDEQIIRDGEFLAGMLAICCRKPKKCRDGHRLAALKR